MISTMTNIRLFLGLRLIAETIFYFIYAMNRWSFNANILNALSTVCKLEYKPEAWVDESPGQSIRMFIKKPDMSI